MADDIHLPGRLEIMEGLPTTSRMHLSSSFARCAVRDHEALRPDLGSGRPGSSSYLELAGSLIC